MLHFMKDFILVIFFFSKLFGLQADAPTLVCHAATITDPNYTLEWTHTNPNSTTVNYDPRVNGIDPGNSVTYPATTFPINLGSVSYTHLTLPTILRV